MSTPPCSKWAAWIGPEIEGAVQRGEATLFVRRGDVLRLLDHPEVKSRKIVRVWLCKEFLFAHTREYLIALAGELQRRLQCSTLCAEIPLLQAKEYEYMLGWYSVYYKWDEVKVGPGVHFCIGPSYSDEAFCLGDGVRVVPEMYLGDIELT